EQDADVVLLCYRDLEDRDDILEVKMAKNRQLGPARAISLQWVASRHSYQNKAEQEPAQGEGLWD
ncbi:hypothetical protein LCGC14_1589470, partial [marine sediment metagenome]